MRLAPTSCSLTNVSISLSFCRLYLCALFEPIWKLDEATKYVKDTLKITDQDDDIANLVKELEYYPLAIKKACSYIATKKGDLQNINGEIFGVAEYVKLYKDNCASFLSEPTNGNLKNVKYDVIKYLLSLGLDVNKVDSN